MKTFDIEIDDSQILAAFNRMQAASLDMSPAMKTIAGLLEATTAQNFEAQSGPLGKWPALKNSSRNKRRTSPKILVDTARLKNSITSQFGPNSAAVGTNVLYAAIHQLGGDIQIAARSQQAYFKQAKDGSVGNRFVKKGKSNFAQWNTHKAHSIDMPARPFLPFLGGKLQGGVEAEILATLGRYLAGG